MLRIFIHFVIGSARVVTRGSPGFWIWIGTLALLILVGCLAYARQLDQGLISSNMRDQLSWGLYIGNFAFLVGVAAAAVVIVIPAYLYDWKPLKNVVLMGELMALAAIVMCILFVTVDVGRPHMIWHMLPGLGLPNFPYSLLVWDVLVLGGYFALNLFVVTYLLTKTYTGERYNAAFIMPLIFLSIPLAISIHTVTAFLFIGLKARPFWHTAVLAPRFLASAFCSGPAILLLIFLILRRTGRLAVSNAALFKIGELLAWAMSINAFLIGVELFADFYAPTAHVIHADFQWFGVHDLRETPIAVYTRLAVAADFTALLIFMIPPLRRRIPLLALGCVLAVAGVFIEKGMGLLLPGMTPDMLGEVYRYQPSLNEILVSVGIWGVGALAFTLMAKVAIAVDRGELRYQATASPG